MDGRYSLSLDLKSMLFTRMQGLIPHLHHALQNIDRGKSAIK